MSWAVNNGFLAPASESESDSVAGAVSGAAADDADAGGVTRTLTITRSLLAGVMPCRRYDSAIWENGVIMLGASMLVPGIA